MAFPSLQGQGLETRRERLHCASLFQLRTLRVGVDPGLSEQDLGLLSKAHLVLYQAHQSTAKLLHGTCGGCQMRGVPEEPPWGAPEESAQPWALRSPQKTPGDPSSLPAPPSHCMSHPNEPPRKVIPRKPASLGPVGPGSVPQTDHPVLTSHSPSTFGTVAHHHVLTSPERFTVHHRGLSAPHHPLN